MSSALIAKQTGLVFAGPVGSLDAYIDRVSQIAVLSKEDEVALAAPCSGNRLCTAIRGLMASASCQPSSTRAASRASPV